MADGGRRDGRLPALSIDLATGYNELPAIDIRLQSAIQAAAVASALVDAITDGE